MIFFISRRHIIVGWRTNTKTILRPTRISIQICGWRQDRLVDLIEIRCTNSPSLRPRTCGRLIVSQPLGASKRYRAPSLRSSWSCNNTQLISPKNMSNSQQIVTNSAKWSRHEITDGRYVCALFLAVWSRERPASSSSSTNGVIVLV
jgi:hypothetical protein